MIYSDEWTGPRFKYAAQYRPISIGFTVPREGALIVVGRGKDPAYPQYPHGTIEYNRELTDDEVRSYELKRL